MLASRLKKITSVSYYIIMQWRKSTPRFNHFGCASKIPYSKLQGMIPIPGMQFQRIGHINPGIFPKWFGQVPQPEGDGVFGAVAIHTQAELQVLPSCADRSHVVSLDAPAHQEGLRVALAKGFEAGQVMVQVPGYVRQFDLGVNGEGGNEEMVGQGVFGKVEQAML
jgi:hypothetical protein